jgi:hypothetical protein
MLLLVVVALVEEMMVEEEVPAHIKQDQQRLLQVHLLRFRLVVEEFLAPSIQHLELIHSLGHLSHPLEEDVVVVKLAPPLAVLVDLAVVEQVVSVQQQLVQVVVIHSQEQ